MWLAMVVSELSCQLDKLGVYMITLAGYIASSPLYQKWQNQ